MQIQFRNFEIELKVRKLFWKNGFKKYKLRTNIGKAKNKIIGKNRDRRLFYHVVQIRYLFRAICLVTAVRNSSSSVDWVFWVPSLDAVYIFAWVLLLFFFSIR